MLESLIASGEPVMFSGVSAVVELFPSPLPEKIPTEPDESEVEGAEDWFSTSHFSAQTASSYRTTAASLRKPAS